MAGISTRWGRRSPKSSSAGLARMPAAEFSNIQEMVVFKWYYEYRIR